MSIKSIIRNLTAIFAVSIFSVASATRISNESSVILRSSSSSVNDFELVDERLRKDNIDVDSTLLEGVVTVVDVLRGKIKVNGSWLYIAGDKTRLFRQGQSVPASVLMVGQLLKFTISAAGPEGHMINVIYVP